MSEEQLRVFLAKVQSDESLQKKLQEEGADAVAIAKEAGFSITNAELLRGHAKATLELSDDELEKAAGGTITVLTTAGMMVSLASFLEC